MDKCQSIVSNCLFIHFLFSIHKEKIVNISLHKAILGRISYFIIFYFIIRLFRILHWVCPLTMLSTLISLECVHSVYRQSSLFLLIPCIWNRFILFELFGVYSVHLFIALSDHWTMNIFFLGRPSTIFLLVTRSNKRRVKRERERKRKTEITESEKIVFREYSVHSIRQITSPSNASCLLSC